MINRLRFGFHRWVNRIQNSVPVLALFKSFYRSRKINSKQLKKCLDHVLEVIYENDEQYRPQDTPLGDST